MSDSHERASRWAMFLLGVWLAGSALFAVVATQNFHTIDRLLAASPNPTFRSTVEGLGHDRSRDLLRYLSSELNRLYFRIWNATQVLVGAAVLWLVVRVRAGRTVIGMVLAMLAISVMTLVWLTPEIASLGRSLDFVPRDVPPPEMRRFWILHGSYLGLELLKLVLGGLAAMMTAVGRR